MRYQQETKNMAIKPRYIQLGENVYKVFEKLNSGNSGAVYRAFDENGIPVAVKKIPKKRSSARKEFESEVNILKDLDHPNIIKLIDYFEAANSFYIVEEYIESDLFEEIINGGVLSEYEVSKITKQLASALNYLHSRKIVHRDIKLENILFDKVNLQVKLCDFGLAVQMKEGKKLTKQVGTFGYYSPELIYGKQYGTEYDIWQLGCVVYSLICGDMPFEHADKNISFFKSKNAIYNLNEAHWKLISETGKNLIHRCFIIEQSKRITATEILELTWTADVCRQPLKKSVSAKKFNSLQTSR